MLSTILIINILISILHSIKHVPQCIHMIEHKNADGLSMQYIRGELLLNGLSSGVTFKLLCTLHHATYLLPILIEKILALSMIITMFYLKQKYSHNNTDIMDNLYGDDWRSVDSEYIDESDGDDWRSVDSEYPQ